MLEYLTAAAAFVSAVGVIWLNWRLDRMVIWLNARLDSAAQGKRYDD